MSIFLKMFTILLLFSAEVQANYNATIPTIRGESMYVGTASGTFPPCTEVRTSSKGYKVIRCQYSATTDYYFFADFTFPLYTTSPVLTVEPIVRTGSTDNTKVICTGVTGSVSLPTDEYNQNDGLGGDETQFVPGISEGIVVTSVAQADLRNQDAITIWDKTTGANCTVANCGGRTVTMRIRRMSEASGCTGNVPADVDYTGVRIWFTRPSL